MLLDTISTKANIRRLTYIIPTAQESLSTKIDVINLKPRNTRNTRNGRLQNFVLIAANLRYTNGEVTNVPNKTTYNVRIDSNIKKEADALYRSMGMSLSSAVNLFLAQPVIQRRLPINEVIAEPFGDPPADEEYNSFDTWGQAKEWLDA